MCLKQLINNFNTAWIKRTHQNSFKTNYKHHVLCSFCEHNNSIVLFFCLAGISSCNKKCRFQHYNTPPHGHTKY